VLTGVSSRSGECNNFPAQVLIIHDSGEKLGENHVKLGSPCAAHRAMHTPTHRQMTRNS
jgi:hypothetical protein